MDDTLLRSKFSTQTLRDLDGYSDNEVFDAWVEAMSTFFTPKRIDKPEIREKLSVPPHESNLIDVFLFPGMLSAQVASSGYHFSRYENDIAREGSDAIGILFWEHGVHYAQACTEINCFSQGDLQVVDFTRVIEGYSSPLNTYSLIIPREALLDLVLDLDTLHLRKLSPTTPAVRLLRRHIYELHKEAPNMGANEAQAMVGATVNMVKAVLSLQDNQLSTPCELMQRNQLLEIRSFIDANLYEPNLNPEFIANKLGISRTQLYRLTEPLNGIKSFITRRRLKRAFLRLATPNSDGRNIAKLAYELGFNSEDTFRRAFTNAFSMTPKEVRERGMQAYYDISERRMNDREYSMPSGELLYKYWMEDIFS